MGSNASTYQKMPGRWPAPFVRRTLWQGPDHLLWVEKTMMQEQYRRFYYKDIQAVIVRRNRRQYLWTFFWAVLMLVTGSLALPSVDRPDMPEFLFPAFFTLVWGVGLSINVLKGPCCEFYLQTAVQLERLSHMARLRAALKIADRIKALAEAAQGQFRGRSPAGGPGAALRTRAAGSLRPAPTDAPFQPGLHWALFGVLLCQGALCGLQLWLRHSWTVFLGLIALAATLVLVITALVHWHRRIKASLLAVVTWLTLILAAAHCMGNYGLFIFGSMRYPQYAYNSAALFKVFFELHREDNPFITALVIGFGGASLVVAIVGLLAVALQGGRRRKQA